MFWFWVQVDMKLTTQEEKETIHFVKSGISSAMEKLIGQMKERFATKNDPPQGETRSSNTAVAAAPFHGMY